MPNTPRNAAAEATALLGAGHLARVLEPSPPAVDDGDFFADDPAAVARGVDGEAVIVTPTSGGDTSWADLVGARPDLADFAQRHWLANHKHLPPVPADYPTALAAFHRLAFGVVAEARRLANTKFGLRFTRGGFGTPFFGADEQVRVEGTTLVRQVGDTVTTTPITSLRAAGDFVGIEPGDAAAEHDSPALGDIDEPLEVSDAAGAFLGDWFGFSWAVLEELRLTKGAFDAERVQLWPGHFDPALAMGDPDADARASYGMSPGDTGHDEPYLYVGAWGEVDRSDPFWNETSFNGASLSYQELLAGDDAFVTALGFFRTGHEKLAH